MEGFRFFGFCFVYDSGIWTMSSVWFDGRLILCCLLGKQWGTQYTRKWRLSSVRAPAHIRSAHLAGDAPVSRSFVRLLVFVYDTFVTSGHVPQILMTVRLYMTT